MTDLERAVDAWVEIDRAPRSMAIATLQNCFRDARTAALQEAAQRVGQLLMVVSMTEAERKEITDAIWGKKQ